MRTFSFKGFTAGSAVSLAAIQAGITETGSVASWGGSLGSIGISTRSADHMFAPAGVHLEATGLDGFSVSDTPGAYNPAYHEIYYVWVVRGQPLPAFSAPKNIVHNNPNVMYGKQVAFYFKEPGSYTIDLWAVDLNNGSTAFTDTTVTVDNAAAADARYPGTNTVCLSSTGDFTGAPAGARLVTVSNTNDINAEFGSFFRSPRRILFRRGETFDNPSLQIGANLEYVGVFGPGTDRATITTTNVRTDGVIWRATDKQHTITGLDFQGPWDSTTETGEDNAKAMQVRDGSTDDAFTLLAECRFSGYDKLETTPGQNTSTGNVMMLADVFITNWRDYGCYAFTRDTDKYLIYLGCRITQHVDALNGGIKEQPHNHHGPLRWSQIRNVIVSQCDLFSRNGWAGSNIQEQPCVRVTTAPENSLNRAIIERCVMEGGVRQINMENETDVYQEYPGNYLFERNLLIASARSEEHISFALGGTTIRNNIGIVPDVVQYGSQPFDLAVRAISDTARFRQDNADTPVRVYNNTMINLQSDANTTNTGFEGYDNAFFGNYIAENNVTHAPFIGAGAVTGDGPFDLNTPFPGITPRYRGVRFKGQGSMDTTYSSVDKPIPLPRPIGNSTAINGGDAGLAAYDDFFEIARPETGDEKGALLTG